MAKDFTLDLTTATPAALHGYILSAVFDQWLSGLDDQQALEMLINRLKKTQTNLEFLHLISRTTPSAE